MIFGAKIQTIRNYCIKHLIVRLANVKIERDSAHMSLSWHYFRVGGCQIDFDLHHHFLRYYQKTGARNVKSRKLDPIFALSVCVANAMMRINSNEERENNTPSLDVPPLLKFHSNTHQQPMLLSQKPICSCSTSIYKSLHKICVDHAQKNFNHANASSISYSFFLLSQIQSLLIFVFIYISYNRLQLYRKLTKLILIR